MKSLLDGKTEWKYNSDVEEHDDYAKIPSEMIHRADMSCKAKTVFAYMTSKPANYQFASKRICKHFKEGYRTILAAITELEECGYITKERKCDGRMLYSLRENWWSLTEQEGKEVLFDTCPGAFKRTIVKYERVTFKQAQEAILSVLQPHETGRSYDLASSYAESCNSAELSMNEKTLSAWIKHINNGAL